MNEKEVDNTLENYLNSLREDIIKIKQKKLENKRIGTLTRLEWTEKRIKKVENKIQNKDKK